MRDSDETAVAFNLWWSSVLNRLESQTPCASARGLFVFACRESRTLRSLNVGLRFQPSTDACDDPDVFVVVDAEGALLHGAPAYHVYGDIARWSALSAAIGATHAPR